MSNFFWSKFAPQPTQSDDDDSSGPHSFIAFEEKPHSPSSQEESFNSVQSEKSSPISEPETAKMADEDTLKKIFESLKNMEEGIKKQTDDFTEFRTKEFGEFRTQVERNLATHNERILASEAAQAQTEATVKELGEDMQKLKTDHANTCKHMGDFHARLKLVEQLYEQLKNQQSAPSILSEPKQSEWKLKDYKNFLVTEMEKIEGYENENITFQNVVVVGPKPKREPVTQTDIEGFLRTEGVPSECFQVFVRGKNGVHAIVFYPTKPTATSPGVSGPALAVAFKDAFPKFYSNMWATIDQNRVLREGRKRAREFGDAYKKKYPSTWWRINDNFLLVDDIVVSPVTLIPGKLHWGTLASKITTARKTQTRKLQFDARLATQINLRIFIHCVKIHRTPSFLDEDDASVFNEVPDTEEDLNLEDDEDMLDAGNTAAAANR